MVQKAHSYKFSSQNSQILVYGLPSQQARFARADADMVEHAAFLKERPKNPQKPSYS